VLPENASVVLSFAPAVSLAATLGAAALSCRIDVPLSLGSQLGALTLSCTIDAPAPVEQLLETAVSFAATTTSWDLAATLAVGTLGSSLDEPAQLAATLTPRVLDSSIDQPFLAHTLTPEVFDSS